MPFVMLIIFRGSTCSKRLNTTSFRIVVCSCDTPFTMWDPITHKCAIRTYTSRAAASSTCFSESFVKIDVVAMMSNN